MRESLSIFTTARAWRVRIAFRDGTRPAGSHQTPRGRQSDQIRSVQATPVFALHSLPASLAEIPGRFSSSLLPPSFVAGRCAANFLRGAVAKRRLIPIAAIPRSPLVEAMPRISCGIPVGAQRPRA